MAMTPSAVPISHPQAHEWAADRIHEPLPPEREARLETHLAGCAECRAVEADYLAASASLRQLSAPIPPRDLAARTFAALDREAGRMAPRWGRAPALLGAGAGRGTRTTATAVSLVSLAVIGALGALLLLPLGLPGGPAGSSPAGVAAGQLAFVGVEGNEVRVYRTTVGQACSPDASGCADIDADDGQVVALPADVTLSDFEMDPQGRHAALAGQLGNETTYYVVDLALAQGPIGPAIPSSRATASPAWSSGSAWPTASAWPSGSSATIPPASVPRVPVVGPAGESPDPTSTATPLPTAGSSPTDASLPPSLTPSVGPYTPPSPGDDASGASSSPGPGGSALPAASAVIVPPPSPGTALGSTVTGAATAGASLLPRTDARPILTNVYPTGMPAAWSRDGSTLAFSARPADGSRGPDIYTWRPGDRVAKPLTSDHASSFASWANGRIVGSMAVRDPDVPGRLIPQSFVIDPKTGERYVIDAAGVWLPTVDPTGTNVIFWRGTLADDQPRPVLGKGRLEVARWSELDPLADGEPAATPSAVPTDDSGAKPDSSDNLEPTPASSSRPGATEPAGAAGSTEPKATVPPASDGGSGAPASPGEAATPPAAGAEGDEAAATPVPGGASGAPAAGASAGASAEPDAKGSTPKPVGTGEPGASPAGSGPAASPAGTPDGSPDASPAKSTEPLPDTSPEPSPTDDVPLWPVTSPVGDFVVAWAMDGTAVGVWVGKKPGAESGTLTVFGIDPKSGTVNADHVIVAPTAARRGFSMGDDRVAWITPPDTKGRSRLNVYSWGPDGGGLRGRDLEQRGVVPAY